ncbi:MAG: DUF4411 family protein [Gammaproteobacteria bacterium]|nr:DUF4411 family protein [Gammaproteobacteria bacterium]MCF6363395.1 DUF4411 family protein [Gammaproteobacteria bacterium]
MSYLLDANVFIQAKNLHYGLDFCPAFWEWLVEQNQAGKVFSIEKVGDEIQVGGDDLSEWAKDLGHDFFLNPDSAVLQRLGDVSQWATSNGYEATAITTFFQVADYYLVGHALADGFTVVTHEIPSSSVKKIKIPNACVGVDVKFMTPFEMLRHENARFVLGATS